MPRLGDLMTADPVTLDPEMTLREAVERLAAAGVSGAPVVSGGRLVGVVSTSDLVEFESSSPGVPSYREEQQEWGEWGPADQWLEDLPEPASGYFRDLWSGSTAQLVERMADPESPEWDSLADHVVGEVMTNRVLALPPDADALDAARVMAHRGVHRILVADGDALRGIVSSLDFVRALADGRFMSTEHPGSNRGGEGPAGTPGDPGRGNPG